MMKMLKVLAGFFARLFGKKKAEPTPATTEAPR